MSAPVPLRRPRAWAVAALVAACPLAVWAAADDFPKPYDSEKNAGTPMPPDEAAAEFQVPDGFTVDVFAAEPAVRNPIALNWDTRGRLWVAENFTYAEREKKYDLSLSDRVLIFHDKDGDGKPDETKVFTDTVKRLTGVLPGRGGVWLLCPPQLLFVPDRDGDDKPDGPPEAVLDGFDVPTENHHNVASCIRWGPDGWLYGLCGASGPGKIRRPDQPPEAAVPLVGGVWRYHPKTKVYESVCHGTTNPWGHDWDARGENFFINTVNGHLWHTIPGAHFMRLHTLNANPFVYEPMDMIADHWHFDTGKDWTASRDSKNGSDQLGGGHAHSGAMIYLGGQWPENYRGRLMTLNFHGRRVNVEKLERSRSSYVGKHEPDMLKSADPFFRGIDLTYGPDGSAFVLDWSDTGECHENTGVHRNSGRIFRVRYGKPDPTPAPDLTAVRQEVLFKHLMSDNEWFVRAARQEIVNREATGKNMEDTLKACQEFIGTRNRDSYPPQLRLRVLWLLHSIGKTDIKGLSLEEYLDAKDEHLRAWAIRLLTDSWTLDSPAGLSRSEDVKLAAELLDRFREMARTDTSGLVRLVLASTLQRLPVKHRPALAAALLSRAEDATDPHLPFLVWYGLIPVGEKNPGALVPLAAEGTFPKVREWTARRLAEQYAKTPDPLDALLARTAVKPDDVRRDVVLGTAAGFAGVRKAAPPSAWKAFPKEFAGPDAADLRAMVQGLDVLFGDGRALDEVRKIALDGKAELTARKAALRTLIEANPPDLRPVCETLLKTRFLNAVALDGLTRFDDPAVGKLIAANYWSFHAGERPAMIAALASRPAFAPELLNLIAKGTVARADLSAFQARQIRSFDKPELTKRLSEVWGELRDSPKDKADLIAKLKGDLAPEKLKAADKSRGRAVYAQACASCHRLFGTGGEIGPDLTGAGRKDLDYLLSNVVDPSAVVNKDFQMTVFALADGRVVNGIVVNRTPQAVTVQTDKEKVAIPKDDIEKETPSPLSLMPDGLLQPFGPDQVRDLVAYLTADAQVDLPAEKK